MNDPRDFEPDPEMGPTVDWDKGALLDRIATLEAENARLRDQHVYYFTRADQLRAAFIQHRTTTHEVAPSFCKTCRESDAALAE